MLQIVFPNIFFTQLIKLMETMISSELRKYEANIVDKTNKLRKIFENSK